ncbi:hypothetical protein GAO09_15185 [Rhizobiales bacterium RZME27]|uniref:UrcA family protein n=1 Tax=Endobacterium cereale TaxID=2663029 RepID=A0A6A8ACC9_9HYPH|nr:hypothetical protein [Endobacterium cereale]MEB2843369.1 hypothetical protein [Endobacterium cereale]MQY47380.1 hypothetical protein [Endobacterium cereale]
MSRLLTVPAILTAAIVLPALLPVSAQAADMVRWQEPPRERVVRQKPARRVVRTAYREARAYECEYLRIDYREGRREIVRNCHRPVF